MAASSSSNADNQNELDDINRQLLLHRRLSEAMGGIVPAGIDLAGVKRVLDVECGAGGWVYDLAWRYPSMHVTGTESDAHLAKEAHALASSAGNATIIEQDLRLLSDQLVPLAAFDMVHARFLVSALTPQEYPSILAALARRCRAGGWLVWEEPEYPLTNSPACEHLYRLIQRALQAANRAFSPGHSLGITAMMSAWLKASGCRIALDHAYALDISAGMHGSNVFQQQMGLICNHLRSFLLQTGVIAETNFESLCTLALQQAADDGFRGVVYIRTMVGVVERG